MPSKSFKPKNETLAQQKARFGRQKRLFETKVGLGQTVSVVYGPTPHPDVKELKFEPNTYKVVWEGSIHDDFPKGFSELELIEEEDHEGRAKIWVPHDFYTVQSLLKNVFNVDYKDSPMHN